MFRNKLHRMRNRFYLIVISTIVVGLGVVSVIAVGLAAAQSNVTGDAGTSTSTAGPNDPDCVSTAKLVSTKDLADGGKVYTYSLDGNLIPEPVPPAGWDPLKASSDEIHQYGLPPRPSDPAALHDWSAKMSRLKFRGKPFSMCTTRNVSWSVWHNNLFPWAGGFTINYTTNVNTYYEATGAWYQTAFQSWCGNPSNSGYSTWAGLGGYNDNNGQQRLIQAGTDVSHSSINGIYPFYELWNWSHPNPEVMMDGNVINGGDAVEGWVYYDNSINGVYAAVIDWDTGWEWSIGPIYWYAYDSAYDYWDGTTADFVTESPSCGENCYYYLRRPYLDSTYYYYATANGQPISDFDSWQFNERNWKYNGNSLMQASGYDGGHAWSDQFIGCW